MANMGDVFVLTDQHLKLIREMCIEFDDGGYDGAPAVNCKRPYGNSGDVAYEVYRVLHDGAEWDWDDDCDDGMPEDQHQRYHDLHRETAIALQICCMRMTFETGTFKKTDYGSQGWEKIEERINI